MPYLTPVFPIIPPSTQPTLFEAVDEQRDEVAGKRNGEEDEDHHEENLQAGDFVVEGDKEGDEHETDAAGAGLGEGMGTAEGIRKAQEAETGEEDEKGAGEQEDADEDFADHGFSSLTGGFER